MTTITIASRATETQTIDAYVRGKFAAHPVHGQLGGQGRNALYTITHVATGYACGSVRGWNKARDVVRRLDKAIHEDITNADFSGGEWTERYRAFIATAKPIIQAAKGAG